MGRTMKLVRTVALVAVLAVTAFVEIGRAHV